MDSLDPLVERLNENNDVIIVDNQSSGNIENIQDLDFSKIDTDLGDITEVNLERIFEDVDYVFHMAAVTSVKSVIRSPKIKRSKYYRYIESIRSCKKCGVKKLIFSSSSAVYGETELLPINEKNPYKSFSPYAVTKATGEMYCRVYSKIYDLSTISLRYFNVFGPKQDPDSQYAAVIPIFIDKLLKNQRPVIYGDGTDKGFCKC